MLDGLGRGCRRLPDEQGIVFPGGYYLADVPAGSAARTFDTETKDLAYEGLVRSPNGEDVLYVFHARAEGRTLLLPYNVIRKEVATLWQTRGWSLLDDGTLIVLARFESEEDAVARANNTEYGLVAYVFTRDIKRAIRVCEGLDTGMVGLNQGMVSNAGAPFGGVKQSGIGREGGVHSLEFYTELKNVCVKL